MFTLYSFIDSSPYECATECHPTMLTHLHTQSEVTLKLIVKKKTEKERERQTTMCNTFYLFLTECGHWWWQYGANERTSKRPTDRPNDEIIDEFSALKVS